MAPETIDIFNEFCILSIPAAKHRSHLDQNNTANEYSWQKPIDSPSNNSYLHCVRCGIYFQESHLFSI